MHHYIFDALHMYINFMAVSLAATSVIPTLKMEKGYSCRCCGVEAETYDTGFVGLCKILGGPVLPLWHGYDFPLHTNTCTDSRVY